jgi:DNA-binding LacI/PurR family transcriptional regulator
MQPVLHIMKTVVQDIRMNMSRINISEIAASLNLSKSTVSRVFNNVPNSRIAPQTRDRVMKAIQEMGYEPNVSAQALAKAKTHLIGLMFINSNNPFVGGFVSASEEYFRKVGYHVLLCNNRGNTQFEEEECRILRQRGVEGLIIEPTGSVDHLRTMLKLNYPFVLLDRCPEIPSLGYVTFDDVEGGRLATQVLIDGGRKKIAHITGPSGLLVSADRLDGYKQALRLNNLLEKPEWIVHTDRHEDVELGRLATERLLALPDRPDAVFCCDDYLALGVMKAAKLRGLKIPDDIALIGYNDSLFCPWTEVPLASVMLDMSKLGLEASQYLLDKIEKPDSTEQRVVKVKPIVVSRESAGIVR